MNEQNTMATSAMNEYGFQAYTFPAEMEERGELQRIDLDFCKYAQATGSNYIETCKRVAAMHAKLARAGRYGGGQWTAWCKARGLSEGNARKMVTIGNNFNSAQCAELKNLDSMPRSLLYAASKVQASPVTMELLASGDPEKVKKGKKLLDAEKMLQEAREEFLQATEQCWNAAKNWADAARKYPALYNAPEHTEIREVGECSTVEEANDVMLRQFENMLKTSTPEEIAARMQAAIRE